MVNNILSTVNIRKTINNKSNAIDNLFAKYKSDNNADSQSSSIDTASIGVMLKDAVDSIFDPTSGMTEEQKKKFIEKLENKIKHGIKLTADEMQYLRINNPIEYAKMAKVQIQREALENRLKSCKSKEEAHDLYVDAMSKISDNDPAKEETIAAYNDTYKDFQKSDEYSSLPNTKKEAEEKDEKAS